MTSPRVVILDIERVPGRAEVDFWDLSQFKNQRLHPDTVTSWPRSICFAWQWHGERAIDFAAEWDLGGHEAMITKAWSIYDEAHVVVGHNVKSFDTAKLRGEWRTIGLPPPSPVKYFDTLSVARAQFGFESNTLDAICKRLGIGAKTDKYEVRTAQAAVAGDKRAQRRIEKYNKGDIVASRKLYEALRPWGTLNYGVFVDDDAAMCPSCLSHKLQKRGFAQTGVSIFQRYQCQEAGCGRWARGRRALRTVEMR